MSDLTALIRLHRWHLDEKQRALAELRSLAERLQAEATRLEAEIRGEQTAARQSPEAAMSYPAYAAGTIERRQRIHQSVAQVQDQIAAAVEEMATAFQEVKRFELAQDERSKREREKLRRRNDALLDETALIGFQRRRADPN